MTDTPRLHPMDELLDLCLDNDVTLCATHHDAEMTTLAFTQHTTGIGGQASARTSEEAAGLALEALTRALA